jgi:mobilization protein MobC
VVRQVSGCNRRRRRLPGGRANQVLVKLSDAELARVNQRAVEMGLTASSYLAEIGQAAQPAAVPNEADELGRDLGDGRGRGAAGGGRLVAEQGRPLTVLERRAVAAELFGVRRLLIGVATNLNQLAKVANSTGRVPGEVPVAAAAVSRYLPRLAAVVAALDPHVGA